MPGFLSRLEERIAEAEKKFHERGERIAKLSEQGAEINREIARLQAEQLELRGAYQEMKKLMDDVTPPPPETEVN